MKLSLFWRTFALITLLLIISLGAWYALYRAFEQPAQSRRVAAELASSVRFASEALKHVPDASQSALLAELSAGKGLSLLRRNTTDQVEPWLDREIGAEVERVLGRRLGAGVTLASRVNGKEGLWVGFQIGQASYWLMSSPERLSASPLGDRIQLGALALLLVLAMIAALMITRLVNGPLANLGRSIDRLSRGEPPPRLREKGPPEIALLNRRFNDLAGDLQAMDADRAIVLAGVSHDVRTPLTRLRLEVEMSPLPESAQASMIEEIERIDSIVHQFVEFASPLERTVEPVDINQVLSQFLRLYSRERAGGMLSVFKKIEHGLVWQGNPVLLERILSNVFENAIKYATTPGERGVRIDIFGRRHDKGGVELIFRDHGPGVPESALPKLARPFARLDTERSTIGGSGLGLAIVARLARRTRGGMIIENASGGGLKIRVVLRDLDSAKVQARETFIDTLDPVSAPAELLQEQQSTRSARRSRPSRSSLPSG
ncbi:MAG: ATP-binding protein [Lautropia sp.]|nr:ATP-binding protein [Lautropia sp.]